MKPDLKRLSIRSVSIESVERLDQLKERTRLPTALLIEDGIDLLWDQYEQEEEGDQEIVIDC